MRYNGTCAVNSKPNLIFTSFKYVKFDLSELDFISSMKRGSKEIEGNPPFVADSVYARRKRKEKDAWR